MTIDGFIGDTNGELDWAVWNWDQALQEYVTELTKTVDCVVLGRKLAQGFIPHWASVAANTEAAEHEAGKIFTDVHKIVFTKTLDHHDAEVSLAKYCVRKKRFSCSN